MKVMMSWSGGLFDILVYPKMWLVVASTIVRAEVFFLAGDLVEESESKMEVSPWIKVLFGNTGVMG